MRKEQTFEHWQSELEYIQTIDPKNPGINFNYCPDTFARYCDMQANFSNKDGYKLITQDILQVRDLAISQLGVTRIEWIRKNNGFDEPFTFKGKTWLNGQRVN